MWIYWREARILARVCDDFGFPAPFTERKRASSSLSNEGAEKGW